MCNQQQLWYKGITIEAQICYDNCEVIVMKKIYVAEDDRNICDIICTHLTQNGYEVKGFPDGEELLCSYKQYPCDLIITDIMMPKMNGYDLCKEIRKDSLIPLIMISANNDEVDRILGLELGSDDYIGKPINMRELTVKVKNALRRMEVMTVAVQPSSVLSYLDVSLDLESRTAYISDEPFDVTVKEFDLLELLFKNVNKAFSRENIIRSVWQYDFDGDARQVDQLIKRLRKKMLLANTLCEIKTVWGFGYKIGGSDEK